jgi:hypothetical protein
MSYGDDIAGVLAQVVEIGPTPAEAELGAAVSRHVSARSRAAPPPSDPEAVAALRETHAVLICSNLGLATTAELLDELRARLNTAGLLDYTTVGG